MPISTLAVALIMSVGPELVVWTIGIVLAGTRYRSHPRASKAIIAAIAAMTVTRVSEHLVTFWLPFELVRRGETLSDASRALGVVSFCFELLTAAAWGVILLAMLGWRRQPES